MNPLNETIADKRAADIGVSTGRYLMAVLTGSTCGFPCWQACEDVCHCSCGGANHGILRVGGKQPQRTAKIDGNFYELVAIVARHPEHTCYAEFDEHFRAEFNRLKNERFPGLDQSSYGEWRKEKTAPIVDRKISASQMKWPEVKAVAGAMRLIWARPAGTEYFKSGNK